MLERGVRLVEVLKQGQYVPLAGREADRHHLRRHEGLPRRARRRARSARTRRGSTSSSSRSTRASSRSIRAKKEARQGHRGAAEEGARGVREGVRQGRELKLAAMPSLKVIRKRISSVKSTQKITQGDEDGRRRAAQPRAAAHRRAPPVRREDGGDPPVGRGVDRAGAATARDGAVARGALHPLLARRPEKKVLLVLFSGDRGLCGAFNTNVNKAAEREWRAPRGEPGRRSSS